MDVVQTITNAAVVAAIGAVLAWMMTGHRRESREDLAVFRTEVHEEIGSLRSGSAGSART